MAPKRSDRTAPLIKACCTCSWIYRVGKTCPMCGSCDFAVAHSVFGKNYFTNFRNQNAWLEKQMESHKKELLLKLELENEYFDFKDGKEMEL